MGWLYRNLVRPILFSRDSEEIHDWTLAALSRVANRDVLCDAVESLCGAPRLPVRMFGLDFPNPVGLAAGMDKAARAVPIWASLGFGFSELGGVTWHSQPGNLAPRMFRVPADVALINRMGFNNPGAEALADRLGAWRASSRWPNHPVGINLGKSKVTPLEDAADDYAQSFRVLQDLADFFVVNVSSPNTPNLRQLQDKKALEEILIALQAVQESGSQIPRSSLKAGTAGRARPILVKVAPDLTFEAIDEILELAGRRSIAGIVATNTTITRPEPTDGESRRVYAESGGLSGGPLRSRSTEVIRHVFRQTKGALPIVGVGGIFNAADAWEKVTAGASLIQLYTGLVYEGPSVAREIVTGLRQRLADSGFKRWEEAVGSLAT